MLNNVVDIFCFKNSFFRFDWASDELVKTMSFSGSSVSRLKFSRKSFFVFTHFGCL